MCALWVAVEDAASKLQVADEPVRLPSVRTLRSIRLDSIPAKLSRRSRIERRMPPKAMSRAKQATRAKKTMKYEETKKEESKEEKKSISALSLSTSVRAVIDLPMSDKHTNIPGKNQVKNRKKKNRAKLAASTSNDAEVKLALTFLTGE